MSALGRHSPWRMSLSPRARSSEFPPLFAILLLSPWCRLQQKSTLHLLLPEFWSLGCLGFGSIGFAPSWCGCHPALIWALVFLIGSLRFSLFFHLQVECTFMFLILILILPTNCIGIQSIGTTQTWWRPRTASTSTQQGSLLKISMSLYTCHFFGYYLLTSRP